MYIDENKVTQINMNIGDLVKVVNNEEMNSRGLQGRYGHIVNFIVAGEDPVCANCGQRKAIHTPEIPNVLVSRYMCFKGSALSKFEAIADCAEVEFNDFTAQINKSYLKVADGRDTGG